MYRVIIVDDEPWAIKGIRNAFHWNQYGFEIIGQFTSSREAFEFICVERPDLVFTDVRMPEISGLDLIRMTNERELDVAFVIISGFSEFAYAQEALRYGALDYCLKPIDMEMTGPLIEKLALHFSKKRSRRNNLILEALTSSDKSELKRLTPLFDDSSNDYFRVVVICANGEKNNFLTFFDTKNTLEVELGSGKTIYILRSEKRSDLEEPFDRSVINVTDFKAIGISSISEHHDNIAKLIKESDLAASKVFLNGDSGIFEYEQKHNMVKPFIDEISSMIQVINFEEIDDMMRRLEDYFNHHSLGMGEVVFFWNQVVSALVGSYYEELKYMECEFLNYSELKERFENFDSLCSFLYDIFVYIKHLNDHSMNESETNTYFTQMIKYIDNNFQNKLYLKELSAKFYINQVYCCQLFKKNLGKTFSEYVTDLRIKKACELLKNTDMSIEEITSEVGYFDYYYFNKVFKKECGITPAKFRKS